MATHTVTGDGFAAHAKVLTANAVDTVNFASSFEEVEVVSDGLAALYVTVDGSAPTVAGPKTFVLPAGVASSRRIPVRKSGPTSVKLISAAGTTFSVIGT